MLYCSLQSYLLLLGVGRDGSPWQGSAGLRRRWPHLSPSVTPARSTKRARKSRGSLAFGGPFPPQVRKAQGTSFQTDTRAFVLIVFVSRRDGGVYWVLTPFRPNAVGLSGTDALGPLPSTAAMQPPAPMPRKSQTVSGQALPSHLLLPVIPQALGVISHSPGWGVGWLHPGCLGVWVGRNSRAHQVVGSALSPQLQVTPVCNRHQPPPSQLFTRPGSLPFPFWLLLRVPLAPELP